MPAEGKRTETKPAAQLPDLTTEEKVDQLAQALLREYLHRTGSTATLALFDAESPRGPKTISSRAVMTALMHLERWQARNKQQRARPFASFMELLCWYRLQKRRGRRNGSTGKDSSAGRDEEDDSSADEQETRTVLADLDASRQRLAALRERLATAMVDLAKVTAQVEAAATQQPKKRHSKADGGPSVAPGEVKKKKKKGETKGSAKAVAPPRFDPLGLMKAEEVGASSAPPAVVVGARDGVARTGPVGQTWNPGFSLDVGLPSASASAALPPVTGDGSGGERRLSYVAGAGMELATNRVRAEVLPLDGAISPSRNHRSLSATTAVPASNSRDRSPSLTSSADYSPPKNSYDPQAKASVGALSTPTSINEAATTKKKERKRVVIVAADDDRGD